MNRLYRTGEHDRHWVAHTPETGYVIFPAEPDGWLKRTAFHGFDPLRIREVPVRLAFNTGFPEYEEREKHRSAAA